MMHARSISVDRTCQSDAIRPEIDHLNTGGCLECRNSNERRRWQLHERLAPRHTAAPSLNAPPSGDHMLSARLLRGRDHENSRYSVSASVIAAPFAVAAAENKALVTLSI